MASKSFSVSAILRADDQASATIGKVRGAFSSLTDFLRTGWVQATAAAAAAFAGLIAVFKSSISSAIESEDALARLNAALTNLGPAAAATSEALREQSAALQEVTRFSDEQVTAAQTLIANMGASADEIPRATQAAVDLAAALKIDLTQAAALVGRTLNGFVSRELGAMIPALKEMEKSALKAGAGVELIAAQFSGRAAADAATFSGALDKLKNSFDELLEKLGESVTQNPAVTASFEQLRAVLQDPRTLQATTDLANAIVGFSVAVVETAQKLPDALNKVADFAAGLIRIRESLNVFGIDVFAVLTRIGEVANPLPGILGNVADSVAALGESARVTGETARAAGEAMAAAGTGADALAGATDRATAAQQRFTQQTAAGREVLAAAGIVMRDFDAEAERLDAALLKVQERFDTGITSQAEYRFELEQVRKKQAELNATISGAAVPIGELATNSELAADAIRDLNSAQSQTASRFNATASAANRAAAAVANFNRIAGVRARDASDQATVDAAIAAGFEPILGGTRINLPGGGSRLLTPQRRVDVAN